MARMTPSSRPPRRILAQARLPWWPQRLAATPGIAIHLRNVERPVPGIGPRPGEQYRPLRRCHGDPAHHLAPPDVERAVLDSCRRRSRGCCGVAAVHAPGSPLLPAPEIELTPEITAVADQTEAALLATHGLQLFEHSRRLVTIAAGVEASQRSHAPGWVCR